MFHHISPSKLSASATRVLRSLSQANATTVQEGKSAAERATPENAPKPWCLCKIPRRHFYPENTNAIGNALEILQFYSIKPNLPIHSFGFFDSFKENTKNTEAIHFLHLKLKVAKHSLLSPDSLFETFFPHAKHAQWRRKPRLLNLYMLHLGKWIAQAILEKLCWRPAC